MGARCSIVDEKALAAASGGTARRRDSAGERGKATRSEPPSHENVDGPIYKNLVAAVDAYRAVRTNEVVASLGPFVRSAFVCPLFLVEAGAGFLVGDLREVAVEPADGGEVRGLL